MSKGTDNFKKVIEQHLQEVAKNDELFAETLKNPEKNIEECITYILNQVKKSGKEGFDDEEIFGMAIHYYDESNIEIGDAISGVKIVTNHSVGLTPEDIKSSNVQALTKLVSKVTEVLQKKKPKTKVIAKPIIKENPKEESENLTLF